MKIINREAPTKYTIKEKFEAGIMLMGSEVKAVKESHADLAGSYVKFISGEAYLVNAKIYPYKNARVDKYDEARSRKLLLHKSELRVLKSKLEQGNLTIVPISLYTLKNLIKLEIALAKPKKKFEKKETIKRKDINREIEEAIKGNI